MADKIGTGDLISREQAIAALESLARPYRGVIDTGDIHRNGCVQDAIAALRILTAAVPAPRWESEEQLAEAIRPELDDLASDVTEDFFMAVAESIARIVLAGPVKP